MGCQKFMDVGMRQNLQPGNKSLEMENYIVEVGAQICYLIQLEKLNYNES